MYDVAIIGAGPAGASAALFAAKAGKSIVMIDNNASVTKRAWVENHYGVDAIHGNELFELGKKQALKFGTVLIEDKAQDIVKAENGYKIVTENGSEAEAKHIIIATGLAADLAEKAGIQVKPGTEPRIKTIIDCDASGKTNLENIWAAGTIAGVSMHTIITAGDGAKVAINIISELNGERYVDHDVAK